jgi:transposase
MPKPYDKKFRKHLVDAYMSGRVSSYREAGEIFGVGHATAARWIRQYRRAGDVAPRAMGGTRIPRLIGAEGNAYIKAQLLESPTLVASELCRLYKQRFGFDVSRATMNRNIRELGFTVKRGAGGLLRKIEPTS